MAGGRIRLTSADSFVGAYGEFRRWQEDEAGSSEQSEQMERLRRNLRLERQSELTDRQQEMLRLRYEENLSVSAIARQLHVNKSTVSRTVNRGQKRLRKYLQYSL